MYPVQPKATQPQQPAVDMDYTLLVVDLRILISRRGTRRPCNMPGACFRLIWLAQRYCKHSLLIFCFGVCFNECVVLVHIRGSGLPKKLTSRSPTGDLTRLCPRRHPISRSRCESNARCLFASPIFTCSFFRCCVPVAGMYDVVQTCFVLVRNAREQ